MDFSKNPFSAPAMTLSADFKVIFAVFCIFFCQKVLYLDYAVLCHSSIDGAGGGVIIVDSLC